MRALVTGSSGFVGGHLLRHLREQGDEIHELREGLDILDGDGVRQAVAAVGPDAVYHLAAASDVGGSWSAPVNVFRVNAEGTLNVLLASRDAGVRRVLVVGSAEEYGRIDPSDLPLSEDAPLRPVSPYGASKVAADHLALQAHLGDGLETLRVRSFNHLGPGQAGRFVASALAEQVARNEAEGRDVVKVGNLEPQRDFTDVRDVVRAYRMLVEAGKPGEVYNVCSGRAVPVSHIAETLVGLARNPMSIEVDPERVRPVDLPVLVGDSTRLRDATGWEPTIALEETLAELLDWWRERISSG